jgi:hypothetical protein
LDAAPAGGQAGCTRDCGGHQSGNRAANTQKNDLKPWLQEQWVIPPEANAEFVCAMEDTLEVYQRPYDGQRPLVGFDEGTKPLGQDVRTPLPAAPGCRERSDYEYERNGTGNLFMMYEPLAGQREVLVTERRTAVDYAEAMRHLVDVCYPRAEQIVLVQDNLNTHKLASLYEAFPPEEARRLIDKLEVHYTPKHGSWLKMAEIKLPVLRGQCLDRRIPDFATLPAEVAAWQSDRNAAQVQVNWQFTTADARVKLKRL